MSASQGVDLTNLSAWLEPVKNENYNTKGVDLSEDFHKYVEVIERPSEKKSDEVNSEINDSANQTVTTREQILKLDEEIKDMREALDIVNSELESLHPQGIYHDFCDKEGFPMEDLDIHRILKLRKDYREIRETLRNSEDELYRQLINLHQSQGESQNEP